VLVEVVLEGCRWSRGCFLAVWLLAEALDVDGDGGQELLDVGFGLAAVAAVAHAVAVGELADGALDAGPDYVAFVPGRVLLAGAVADLQSGQFPRGKRTVRLPSPEVVHAARTGQGWHWLLVNLATMSGAASGEEVRQGPCHPLLTWPCGQVTSRRSKPVRKSSRA
jgi:hypothetical protein